jgi:predicted house-cleaning noncanonical NTP pyrophosphatase (MazG superfamily)
MRLKKKDFSNIFAGLALLALVFGIFFIYKHFSFKNNLEDKVKKEIEEKITAELDKVTEQLNDIQKTVVSITEKLGTTQLNTEAIQKLLQETLKKNDYLVGIGAAFEPRVISEDIELFAPYYQKEKDQIISTPINYNYTKPEKGKLKPDIRWYTIPLTKDENWKDPYYYNDRNIVIGEYAKAIYKEEEQKKPLGIVFVEFNLDAIKEVISYLSLGKNGYGFLLSKTGTFISHYINEYVTSQKTIFNLEKEGKKRSLVQLGKRMLNGEEDIVEYTDYITENVQKDSWAFLHQIKPVGWHFAAVYFKDEVIGQYLEYFKKNKILITVAILFFLLFLLTSLIFRCAFNKTLLILYAITCSLLLVLGIGLIWMFSFEEGFAGGDKQVIITSRADVLQFFKSSEGQTNIEQPINIPTGIIVNYLDFLDVNTIHVSGYLWQQYSKDTKIEDLPQFSFEKSANSDIKIKNVYEQEDKKIVEIHFKCAVPIITQYDKYPFDNQKISLKLVSKNRESDQLLIPDFQAYAIITPSSLPGVLKSTSLKGWNFKKSYFAYNPQLTEVNYGLNKEKIKKKPLLSFNIIIKRLILQPFLSFLLPLIIILFLMFMILLSVDKMSLIALFSAYSALMLSIVFSHISLREKLPISGFFYLEYFYLVSYLLIVLVSLNIFLYFKSEKKYSFIDYKKNIIAKLMYWPVTLLIMFILTAYLFYF